MSSKYKEDKQEEIFEELNEKKIDLYIDNIIIDTGDEAWSIGEIIYSEHSSTISKWLLDSNNILDSVALKDVLSLAKEAPIFGAIVGVMMKFYESYQCMQEKRESLQELFDMIETSSLFLKENAQMLKKSELLRNESFVKCLKMLVQSIEKAAALLLNLQNRLNHGDEVGIVAKIKSIGKSKSLCEKDDDDIRIVTQNVRNYHAQFMQTVNAQFANHKEQNLIASCFLFC